MEQLLKFGDMMVLLTTGANRDECQQWEWYDTADVVISIDARGAVVLKGERRLAESGDKNIFELFR